MIKNIYISAAVRKRQYQLGRYGKKGMLAQSGYYQLLDRFISKEYSCLENRVKRTKHGELRVENCIKYDLGSGFRLVTIKSEYNLFLAYLGTHDDVDQWLENNSGYTPKITNKEYGTSIQVQQTKDKTTKQNTTSDKGVLSVDLYEEQIKEKLDEQTLKYVFSGLFAAQKY